MSDIVQIVTLVCSTVAAMFTAYLTYRLAIVERISRSNNAVIKQVAHQTNGAQKEAIHESIMKAFDQASVRREEIRDESHSKPPADPPIGMPSGG